MLLCLLRRGGEGGGLSLSHPKLALLQAGSSAKPFKQAGTEASTPTSEACLCHRHEDHEGCCFLHGCSYDLAAFMGCGEACEASSCLQIAAGQAEHSCCMAVGQLPQGVLDEAVCAVALLERCSVRAHSQPATSCHSTLWGILAGHGALLGVGCMGVGGCAHEPASLGKGGCIVGVRGGFCGLQSLHTRPRMMHVACHVCTCVAVPPVLYATEAQVCGKQIPVSSCHDGLGAGWQPGSGILCHAVDQRQAILHI